MSSRSLNKVIIIGNLTRDPELRYTPAGTAVCSMGVATNRSWTTQTGETKEETEFHRVVAWNKLAELCAQLLSKGRKVYLEGRLSTRSWTGQDGNQRTTTEIVVEDMIVLDSKRTTDVNYQGGVQPHPPVSAAIEPAAAPAAVQTAPADDNTASSTPKTGKKKTDDKPKEEKAESPEPVKEEQGNEDITPDDIPF